MHQIVGAGRPSPAAHRLMEHRPHHLVAAASQQKLEAAAVVSLILLLYLACLRWKGGERTTAVEMYS